ncbi:uncharacterized protein LOC132307033 [Cornus florida]|uniref:uncharacterized protein LOC132307033 n=1 Tax=Cornus florida TaxID=4283 RepID=UPI002899C395|nr:uncharacterized protein LOC132307033 [Cornus florida]
MWNDENELQRGNSAADDDEFDDCSYGAGSDGYYLLELGETGEEFCQVGDHTCSIPFELYDLSGLSNVLSVDVWNDCLTEEEQFQLTEYLPDMDQEMFMMTLKELFEGYNFHFGSPINKLFEMLKGGLCEPRVALYRQGLNVFQNRQHYHLLRKHQDSMVTNFYEMRDAWINCRGYSIDEKLRVLNILKSQKNLMNENMEELETQVYEREESGEGVWSEKLKDWQFKQKMGHRSAYGASPSLEFPSQGRVTALEQAKFGMQNPKGTLKLTRSKTSSKKELVGRLPSVHHNLEMKSGRYSSALAHPQKNKVGWYDSGSAVRVMDQMRDDAEEAMYEVAKQNYQNFSRISAVDKTGVSKLGKKYETLKGDECSDSFMGLPMYLTNDLNAYGRNKAVNQLSDIEVSTAKPTRISHGCGKKVKYPENAQQFAVEEQMKYVKGWAPDMSLKRNQIEMSDGAERFWHDKAQGEAFPVYPSFQCSDWNNRSKKWKREKESPGIKVNSRLFSSDYRARPSHENVKTMSGQNGGQNMAALKGVRTFSKSEETESDSSEQLDEDEDVNPSMRSKLAYPNSVLESHQSTDPRKAKFFKKDKKDRAQSKDKKDRAQALDGLFHSSRKIADLDEHLQLPKVENYSSKAKQKHKMHYSGHLHNSAAKLCEDSYFNDSVRLSGDDDGRQLYKLGKNGQWQGQHREKFHIPSLKAYTTKRRQRGEVERGDFVSQSNCSRDHIVDEDDSLEIDQLAEEGGVTSRLGKKGQVTEAFMNDHRERFDVPILGCNSVAKKRKVKEEDVTYMSEGDDSDYQQLDETTSIKKWEKRKLEDDTVSFEMGTSVLPVTETGVSDVELEFKPRKRPFTLITPTVHNGFSFSIIHLLSAVRMAMISLLPEDSSEVGKHLDKNDGRVRLKEEQDRKLESNNGVHLHENLDINNSDHSGQRDVPFLTVLEIVNRVRSNPGDPCILETQEPLQDLVRGVLKIFSSKLAPLGAKSWKALVFYEKSTKSWSWIGPVSNSLSDHEAFEEVTSPEAWGLPHKMLVKLVDSFANWLKSDQKTLQQIGSLPSPPLTLMQFNLDEKERFRDLRAQRSLTTINRSSEEVRAYFRKEEVLRYSIPDRAFSYTAVDGRKSIVAPLRRCGGKLTSKARDHFILKHDRPPHVTILGLVRDAAARLPGSIGTRADVCTLFRDSQYIVEDVSDAKLNQVISGALDRLHYERDPCVQYDGERKLWVYLHREREEEDFEDDGTSSTKKSKKRQTKGAAEPFDQGALTVAYHGEE